LTLGISLDWIYQPMISYAYQGIEQVSAPVATSSPFSSSPSHWNAPSSHPPSLAQSSQRPRAATATQQFGDVVFHGNWRIDKSGTFTETGVPGRIIILMAPGPVQFDLTNANVPRNYRLRARITVYDQLFDPKPIKQCWMNFNSASPDPPCVLDAVRPLEIVMYAKWLGGPQPKGRFNSDPGKSQDPRYAPFIDSPSDFYFMEGNNKPLYSIIKNARRTEFGFPATPKPKEEDTRRCWRGITGVVSCW
jgi:hypothetical protein